MHVSKAVMTVSSVAIAAMFGGGVYLMMNFGSIAKNMTERVATETLGVKITVDGLDVDFKNKAVTVSGVKVGNPQGYTGAYAATLEKISLKADTLSQTLLKFNDVAVTGSEIYLELRPEGTNLTDIKSTVNSKAAQGDAAAQQVKVIIENMRIEKMRVLPNALLLGTKLEPITVPDLVLTGVGVKENGVLASEALTQVWHRVVERVNEQAGNAGYFEGLNSEALEEVGASGMEQFKEKMSEELDEIGGNIRKAIGGE